MRGQTSLAIVLTSMATASLAASSAAHAADMAEADIKTLVSGNTLYLEFPATNANTGPGQGVVYHGDDGRAASKFPNGNAWQGTWKMQGAMLCIDWKDRPKNPCTRYDKQGETVTLINVETGQPRGKIVKVVPGNAEKL